MPTSSGTTDDRVYGLAGRREFVTSLPCIACSTRSKPRHGHHTVTGGMSTKAGYMTIVPLCWECHNDCHRMGRRSFAARHRISWEHEAFRVECQWHWRMMHDLVQMAHDFGPGIDGALCRWSTDGFRSDLYVLPSDGRFAIHVAPYRLESPVEVRTGLDADEWMLQYRDVQRHVKTCTLLDIEHPLAGTTTYADRDEALRTVAALEMAGMVVPATLMASITTYTNGLGPEETE